MSIGDPPRAVVLSVAMAPGAAWYRGKISDGGLLLSAPPVPGAPFYVWWQELGGDLAGFLLALRRWGVQSSAPGFSGNIMRATHPNVARMAAPGGPLSASLGFTDQDGPRYFFPGRGPLMEKLLRRYCEP